MAKEKKMSANLKIEGLQNHSQISLRNDLMGISLLALLLAPLALVGVILYALDFNFMTTEVLIICIATLIAALPKLIQLLIPEKT